MAIKPKRMTVREYVLLFLVIIILLVLLIVGVSYYTL